MKPPQDSCSLEAPTHNLSHGRTQIGLDILVDLCILVAKRQSFMSCPGAMWEAFCVNFFNVFLIKSVKPEPLSFTERTGFFSVLFEMKANSWSHLYFLVFVSGFLVSSFPIFGAFQGETQLSLFANFQVCIWSYLGTKTDRHLCQSVVVMVVLHTSIKHPWRSAMSTYFSHHVCGGGCLLT